MSYNTISYKSEDGIGIITFNRPEVMNALNRELIDELDSVLKIIEGDDEVKVVILTGSEKFFSAGADIREINKFSDSLKLDLFLNKVREATNYLETLPKPSIAAISGLALGGGFELSLACDLRIAAENAVFGQPEINIGIIPGGGGTQRLPRLIGVTKAKELLFTGKTIKADDALKLGLVNRVVSLKELMNEAKKMAMEIAAKPPLALRMIKMALTDGLQMNLPQALAYEVRCFEFVFFTEDRKEGISAFIEKRKPKFKGK